MNPHANAHVRAGAKARAVAPPASLLRLSVGARVSIAGSLAVGLWALVLWVIA